MNISIAEIGEAIRCRRRELGFSQEKLAEYIGVTSQQVQRYEYGKTRIKVDHLQAIARALGVSPGFFFGDHGRWVPGAQVLLMGPTERTLVERFRKIRNDKVRELVVTMLKYASEGPAEPP
ncbi:MAG: helix-turn-helix transcriptional regulator [Desulfuromonadaceae bacterium]|nr:helix-turn-helix transcriptional regulator [Desulfuromonadaceae bacterium]